MTGRREGRASPIVASASPPSSRSPVTIAAAPITRRASNGSCSTTVASSNPQSAAVPGWIMAPCPSGVMVKPVALRMPWAGPARIKMVSPRAQPMPPRLLPNLTMPGSRIRPAHTKRWNARSTGAKPARTPCSAATKPAAQLNAAPVPQATPTTVGVSHARAGLSVFTLRCARRARTRMAHRSCRRHRRGRTRSSPGLETLPPDCVGSGASQIPDESAAAPAGRRAPAT